ncbi:MAG: YggT family protein [Candidatus Schekmanbacteria bacterium]|nr:YggT family protein [Candidatus Schekmanbacteria bacterium]
MSLPTIVIQEILSVLDTLLSIYMWLIIARAIVSWVSPDPYNPIVRFLHQVTEPLLARVRRLLPFGGYSIDFSPLIVILVINILRRILQEYLFKSIIHM